MEAFNPVLVTALTVMCAGALMVQAGLAKRQIAWRPPRTRRERRRRS
jgi:hypothetical protein